MAKRFSCEFEGMDKMIAEMTALGGNVKEVTEKALKESHAHATKQLKEGIAPHRRTGRTERSLVETAKISWSGDIASTDVGFDISNGGLPSVFLMHGTPKMKKDQKLYNAVYGKKAETEIRKIQEEIFFEALRKLQ